MIRAKTALHKKITYKVRINYLMREWFQQLLAPYCRLFVLKLSSTFDLAASSRVFFLAPHIFFNTLLKFPVNFPVFPCWKRRHSPFLRDAKMIRFLFMHSTHQQIDLNWRTRAIPIYVLDGTVYGCRGAYPIKSQNWEKLKNREWFALDYYSEI